MFNKKHKDFKLSFLLALFLGWSSMGWIDPFVDKVREGNLLYHNGKYDEALDKYVNAQINSPNIPQLDFNIADTQYKRGKYSEAAQLFEKVIKSEDVEMKVQSSFNMGNTMYRQGKMKEALECYKKTLDFIDEAEQNGSSELEFLENDAKYNYEYVERKMREEEQRQQSRNEKEQPKEEDQKKDDEQTDKNKGKDKEEQKPQKDKEPSEQESTQEKNETEKDEDISQSRKDKQKDQSLEQQLQKPENQRQMSKEEAERLLEALNQSEKEARVIKRDTQRLQHKSVGKDW